MKTAKVENRYHEGYFLSIVIGTKEELLEWSKKNVISWEEIDHLTEGNYKGLCITDADGFIFLNTTHCETLRELLTTAAHECFHLAVSQLDSIGQEFDVNNHEIFAYEQEFYFNQCIKLILDSE